MSPQKLWSHETQKAGDAQTAAPAVFLCRDSWTLQKEPVFHTHSQKYSPRFTSSNFFVHHVQTSAILITRRDSQVYATHLSRPTRSCDTGPSSDRSVLFVMSWITGSGSCLLWAVRPSECDGMGCRRTSAEAIWWCEAQKPSDPLMCGGGGLHE